METLNYEKFFNENIIKQNKKIIESKIDLLRSSINETMEGDHNQLLQLDFALISANREVTVYNIRTEIKTKVYNCELPF